MAAKVKAPVKAKKAVKKATAAKNTAAPKGLQLTTAQQAAYNKAFNATATLLRNQLALKTAATAFRKYRLNAARSTIRAYGKAYASAQAASVAAHAARMSWVQSRLAHQNSALQARIELDMYNHANLLGRAQYAQGGIRAYMRKAVMRTLDQAQAMTYEQAVFSKINSTAKKASASVTTFKSGPNSASITAAATAAGLRAARKVSPKAAPVPVSRTTRKTKTGTKTAKAVKAGTRTSAKAHATSGKAPVKAPKKRTAPMYGFGVQEKANKPPEAVKWLGNEFTPDCVIIAVANHLLHMTGITADDASVRELTEACPAEPVIEEVLWQAWLTHWPRNSHAHLKDYQEAADISACNGPLIVGYHTEHGDHAALRLEDGQVVSWGSVSECGADIEEAWELQWES